jgi:hypothetical protein
MRGWLAVTLTLLVIGTSREMTSVFGTKEHRDQGMARFTGTIHR